MSWPTFSSSVICARSASTRAFTCASLGGVGWARARRRDRHESERQDRHASIRASSLSSAGGSYGIRRRIQRWGRPRRAARRRERGIIRPRVGKSAAHSGTRAVTTGVSMRTLVLAAAVGLAESLALFAASGGRTHVCREAALRVPGRPAGHRRGAAAARLAAALAARRCGADRVPDSGGARRLGAACGPRALGHGPRGLRPAGPGAPTRAPRSVVPALLLACPRLGRRREGLGLERARALGDGAAASRTTGRRAGSRRPGTRTRRRRSRPRCCAAGSG